MREVAPGIVHWRTFHDPIGTHVSSYYVPSAGIVIDPKVPERGFEELPGAPEQVVLTNGLHHRDAARFADHFGIPIRAIREAARRLDGRLDVEPCEDGDEIAPGVTAIHIGALCDDESALHIAVGDGAVAFADGLHRYDDALDFFPDDLLGDDPEGVKQGLRAAYARLLQRDFDALLFAHGDPLVSGGRAALRDAVG